MNAQDFIAALQKSGYRKWKPNEILSPHAESMFQKRIDDKDGTKYYITCNYYSKSRAGRTDLRDSFDFDLQFNKEFKGKEYTLNIKLFSISDYNDGNPSFYPLEDIEELIEEIFQKQKFSYYESNT